jgi:ribosomal protein S18 acetylase RimI-like enzyme
VDRPALFESKLVATWKDPDLVVVGRGYPEELVTRILPARRDDARAIAEVRVASWQYAHRGLVPNEYLDSQSVDDRESYLLSWFSEPVPRSGIFVAEGPKGIVGFVMFSPSRDDDAADDTGEIPMIYVDPEVFGRGVGRSLFSHATDALRASGFLRATLWVMEGNRPARRFYERLGWSWDGTVRQPQYGGKEVDVVRYRREL